MGKVMDFETFVSQMPDETSGEMPGAMEVPTGMKKEPSTIDLDKEPADDGADDLALHMMDEPEGQEEPIETPEEPETDMPMESAVSNFF